MKTSNLFSVDWQDITKGFVIAVVGAVLTAIQNVVSAGSFDLKWSQIGSVAATAGISYLLKNFFTSSQTIIRS